ncbi:short-chain dehydrogenase/reductase [Priestia megaterium]|uniref:Short-chain dehydrogenase/reductase n=1 Tax=Priestia megaterium TaxID=1404 RepID=A0A3D8WTP3_PRIMG|nr:oxidoreductase [Priestia megaterium]MDH3168882.1 oxidoreductase [Priestia megaterium]RDZ06405.1 short-chain dehydrogenase/reductase [Priestia megaterium]
MNQSKNGVVLITGASAGMGKATAELLLEKGYIVYGAARRVDKMKDLEVKGARILAMDVTDEQSMIDGVNRIIQEQGRIDVLFNNAGYGSYGAVEDVPLDEAKRQFEVNLFGLSRLTQLVLPHMRKQKSGKIINNSSMGGKVYTPLGAWYHATKHALEGYSDCLRFEVAQFGIDVVIIEPGSIESEWNDITLENVQKTSGHTAYAKMTKAFVDMSKRAPKSTSPKVIAEIVLQAIESKKPKTRYVAGQFAKPLIALRKLVSDRMYDGILYRMFKIK